MKICFYRIYRPVSTTCFHKALDSFIIFKGVNLCQFPLIFVKHIFLLFLFFTFKKTNLCPQFPKDE